MKFEWDENKRLINIRKHGIDFLDVESIFENNTVIIEDGRLDYGEQRWLALGLLQGRVVVVVYTERKRTLRIISIRKGTKYEQRTYFEQISY
ncbi:MAG: BrnT family toxin [Microcystaceae cyanobacterium]